ncbi:MAG: hypothetical protein QN229_02160 [Desulfurococcaceae archaeon TW002]
MNTQYMSIYTRIGLDEILATAVLSTALVSKGIKAYVEFVPQIVKNPLKIVRSYVVGITSSPNISIHSSISFLLIPEKRLGVVTKYDDAGKSEVLMSLSETYTLTQVALEYVQTLNTSIDPPEQLIKDIIHITTGKPAEASKVGKALVKAIKICYSSPDFLSSLYSYFLQVLRTKSYKLSPEIEERAAKYDEALRLVDELLKSDNLLSYGPLRVAVISRSFENPLIRDNYKLLKPLVNEILTKLCKEDGIGMVVLETDLGHTLKICLGTRRISFVNIISSLPKELSDELSVTLKGNHLLIKFKDPFKSSLDALLSIADSIATGLTPLLTQSPKT